MLISVIMIILNEEQYIEAAYLQLQTLQKVTDIEIIVVDGGSTDQTVSIAKKYTTVLCAKGGKSAQLNAGAGVAKGDVLFFVHADMLVPPEALLKIREKIESGYDGGGFSNVFDRHNMKIKRLGRIMNLRLFNNDHDRNLIFFGDNGIFVKSSVFKQLKGFKDIPIMEDYDFSYRLRADFRSVRIKDPLLVVSARRHEKAGFFKTRCLWIAIKWLYLIGIPPRILTRWYANVR
jgi:rSAM/selenodomain-associated transferase 2